MAGQANNSIFRKLYFSNEHGSGSIHATRTEPNKQHPGITLQNVQEWTY